MVLERQRRSSLRPLERLWILWAALAPALGWHPVPAPLATRWASAVSPGQRPAYPRPMLVRASWEPLCGLWELGLGANGSAALDPAGRLPMQILVPYPLQSSLSGVRRQPAEAWYRRWFGASCPGRAALHFEAVSWEARVWLNGIELGEHRGGYDRFSFDVSRQLRRDRPNQLVVRVRDGPGVSFGLHGKQIWRAFGSPGGISYTSSSGIWQVAWLECLPAAGHVTELLAVATQDLNQLQINITIDRSGSVGPLSLDLSFDDPELPPVRTELAAGASQMSVTASFAGAPTLWSPESPKLYYFNLSLAGADSVRSYAAMRRVSIGPGGRLLLNGRAVYMAGVLDQGFWPDGLYTAPTDQAIAHELQTIKRLGFNGVRKHLKVEPSRWYHHADRLGLLVWQDLPSGPGGLANQTVHRQLRRELEAMVRGRRAHPSIVIWALFNEGLGQPWRDQDEQFNRGPARRYAAGLLDAVRRLDSTRLVNVASGWHWMDLGDVIDSHSYPGASPPNCSAKLEPVGPRGGLDNSSCRKSVRLVGEYGGLTLVPAALGQPEWFQPKFFPPCGPGNCSTCPYYYKANTCCHGYGTGLIESLGNNSAALTKVFVNLTKQLAQRAAGLSGSIYTQLAGVETECNGLLTYNRVLKVDAKAVNQVVTGLIRQMTP